MEGLLADALVIRAARDRLRTVIADLSKMNQGVSKMLMSLVKEIMEPMTQALLSNTTAMNVLGKLAMSGMSMVLNEVLGLIPGPTLVFNAIRKVYKTARMTYKLVNKGVQMQRRLVRICTLQRLAPTRPAAARSHPRVA